MKADLLNLTEEQRGIRDLAREFAAQEIAPFIAEWDEITAVERDRDGALKLTNKAKDTIAIPKTIHALNDLETYFRTCSKYK